MSELKYPHLFAPIQAAGTLFRNRIFASPEGFYNISPDCFPNADCNAFFEHKARGGFASVCLGDCIVDRETGRHYDWLFRIDDERSLPMFSSFTSAISRHGCVASAELSHAGMYALASYKETGKLYGPVEMDNKYGHVTEMSEEMIEYLIERYGAAARFAKQCGFGMVTIHGGHGWLLPQFMSSKINTRNDKWGGSFENRMRFPLAVVESIRKNVGRNFPIEFRMSGSETNPDGYDIDEGIEFAKALDQKVDIIHVSTGNHEVLEATVITHPSMFLPDGCNAQYAAAIKPHVKSPVATVGAFTDPAQMEEVIASGMADIVELGRQTLADPDLPVKARTGREDEINRCMRCCCCFGSTGEHRIFYCAINPTIGHELEERYDNGPKFKKKVLVAGGGIGGMQAALTAAERGHQVILCEKKDRLGGVLVCEEEVPFKQKLAGYIGRQILKISRAPIEVRLNTEVTPELIREVAPDAVIAALGSRPAVPPVKGIDGKNVFGAEEIYYDTSKAGENTVILGAGLVGMELGLTLAMQGRKVTILEMADAPNFGETGMHPISLGLELKKFGVEIRLSTMVTEITADGVEADGPDGHLSLPADTVIYATGQKPLREEAAALSDFAGEFYYIGDCVTPKNILTATQAAYTVARDIGRI